MSLPLASLYVGNCVKLKDKWHNHVNENLLNTPSLSGKTYSNEYIVLYKQLDISFDKRGSYGDNYGSVTILCNIEHSVDQLNATSTTENIKFIFTRLEFIEEIIKNPNKLQLFMKN